MRFAGVIFTIILLASAAPGQNEGREGTPDSPQPQSKPGSLCAVEGVILKTTTGEPAKKVTVTLSHFGSGGQTAQQTAIADTNGHFIFQEVAPGKYTMQAGGNGYPFQMYGQEARGPHFKTIALEPGQHEKDIVFKLAPGAVITGTVSDEDGDPVLGANVQALQAGGASRGRGLAGGAQSNDRGEYRIFGLEAGKYFLMVNAPNQNVGANGEYMPTYYPGTTDPSQASRLEVHPGDEMSTMNLIVTRVPCQKVRGRLIIAGSARLSDAHVMLIVRDSENAAPGRSYGAQVDDEKGDFVIQSVPQGSYFAYGYINDGQRNMMGSAPVDVTNGDVDNLVVTLKPPFDLRGRARAESGAPLDFARLSIWLQPSDNQMVRGGGAALNSDGTFVINDIYDGNYRIRVEGYPEEFYLKSAGLGDVDLLGNGATLTSSQAASWLEILLSRNSGTVSGTVLHDSHPVPGALVALVPDPPNRNRVDLVDTKTADNLGRFTLLGLPPGDFKIFAWDSPQEVNPRDPEFLKPFEDRGQHVHVEEKRLQTVQLESISVADQAQ